MQTQIITNPYLMAREFLGVRERPGDEHEPFILWCLQVAAPWAHEDEIAWCAGFVSRILWMCGRKDLLSVRARDFMRIGWEISLEAAQPGWDLIVLKQRLSDPGTDVVAYRGHVGFFHNREGSSVFVLGGNQGNAVSVVPFPRERILAVRRLAA
jgi:uncharacterized protein (TIGR02594 family)